MPLTATLHYTFRVTTRQLVSNFAAACRHLGARYRHQQATPFQGSCGNCFVRSFTACTWVAGWLHVQEACAAPASRLQRWRSQLVMLLWSITSWTSCTLLVRLLQLFIFLPLSLLFSLSHTHTHTHKLNARTGSQTCWPMHMAKKKMETTFGTCTEIVQRRFWTVMTGFALLPDPHKGHCPLTPPGGLCSPLEPWHNFEGKQYSVTTMPGDISKHEMAPCCLEYLLPVVSVLRVVDWSGEVREMHQIKYKA